jgi:hypothetical protein
MFMQPRHVLAKRRHFTTKTWRVFSKTRRLLAENRHPLLPAYLFTGKKQSAEFAYVGKKQYLCGGK